jgi:hypothetical protein
MTTYRITIDFRKGPSYGPTEVRAGDEQSARFMALREAQGVGFNEEVKRYQVREA